MSAQPNVLWIFGDQHRAQALSCEGDANLHTPHIDRLAAEGVSFTRAYANYPLCCPARGTLLTSRYPHECVPGHEHQLPPEQPTIAHALRDVGYHTAYFGKWHLDGHHERDGRAAFHIIPPERRGGFERWLGYENNNSPWDCHVHGDGPNGENWDTPRRLPGYETDALTDVFIGYLRERAQTPQQPFFAVLSVQPPHDPYVAPSQWMARHNPARLELRPNVPQVAAVEERARRGLAGYYAAIEALDWNIGRIREALDETGLWENTQIIFFSDHGDLHGCHGQFMKTAPWEESARVPLILSGGVPYYGQKRGRIDAPVSLLDMAPTTLGLCSVAVPQAMRGRDLAGYRRPDVKPNEATDVLLQAPIPTMHGDSIDRPWRGIVTPDGWKYCVLEGQPWLLFNLNDDPFELVNLAHNTRVGSVRCRLNERLREMLTEIGDGFTLPQL